MNKNFKIQNRIEARKFDQFLKKYCESNCHIPFFKYLNLIDWFDWCQNNKNYGGRIFISVFDIKLNFLFIQFEMIKHVQAWEGRDKNIDILNNIDDFKLSIDLLRYLSSYVLKYRALFDKLMGLIFLCYASEDYDKYRKGNSRKTIFKKIFSDKKIPLDLDPDKIFSFLEQFDTRYRTPEAHFTGSMRKWIFSDIDIGFRDYYNISLNSWQGLIYMISEIDKVKE